MTAQRVLVIVGIVLAAVSGLVALTVGVTVATYALTYRFPPHIAGEFRDALDSLANPDGTLQVTERYSGCHPLTWNWDPWQREPKCHWQGPHDAAYTRAWYSDRADAKARFEQLRDSLPAVVNGVEIGEAVMLEQAPGADYRWDFVAPVRFTDGTELDMDCTYLVVDEASTPPVTASSPDVNHGLFCGLVIER